MAHEGDKGASERYFDVLFQILGTLSLTTQRRSHSLLRYSKSGSMTTLTSPSCPK